MPAFTHDGIRYAYGDTVPGDLAARPVVVFFHDWLASSHDLRPIGKAFEADHRIVALDAAGHGCSAQPDVAAIPSRVAVGGQADATIALVDHLAIGRAVLIGHGVGGAVAVEVAARRPGLAEAVVALDSALLTGPRPAAEQRWPVAVGRSDWRTVIRTTTGAAFLPTDDRQLLDRARGRVDAAPDLMTTAVLASLVEWDREAALASIRTQQVPLLYVDVDGSDATGPDRLAELVPEALIGRAVGVGHHQLIGHPAQAVAMIHDFLRVRLHRVLSAS